MKCPKCKAENLKKGKYCSECGAKLAPTGEVHPSPTQTMVTTLRDLPIGSTFAGRYQVIEELGLGGMGRVYKVLDKTIHERIALKLLNPDIAAEARTIERFRNELKLARKISHRHVCRMYDLSEAEDAPYITMEYISGEDLKSLIKRAGQVSVGKAVHIATQICEGLTEAHRLGVVHRDLKPQNIMIDMEGNAKITDFGIARSTKTKGLTDTGVIIGTPEYMSPEQVEGKEVDQRTDIYSLGVILYELVTGRVPFEGDTPLSVAVKHKIEEPRPPKNINAQLPEDLNRVILKCMAKDKNHRFQSAKELLSDLKKIEKGEPTTDKVIPERKTRISRQLTVTLDTKKVLWPALIVVAALVLIVAALKFFPKRKSISPTGGLPSLAVMYFENNTGDEALDHWRKALSDLLISDLSQSRYLSVLSGERLYNILEKMNLLEARSYSSDDLSGVAERGEVENVLVGRYALAGDTFRISIQLQNAFTGEVLGSETVQGEGQESIFTMVDELTTKIKSAIQLSSEEIAGDIDATAESFTTSSPEAFRYYSEGMKFFNRGDYANTVAMMELAVGFDPEFAMAYRTLSVAYSYLGYGTEAVEKLQTAYDLSGLVSEKERYTIQGQYFSQSEKTFQSAIEAYEKLLDLYPMDEVGNSNLGYIYMKLEDWPKAIERFEMNRRKKSDSVRLYTNLAAAYARSGQFDKAQEALDFYIGSIGDNVVVHYALVQNYLAQGKLDMAAVEAEKLFTLDPSHYLNNVAKGDLALYGEEFGGADAEYTKLLDSQEPAAHHLGFMRLGLLNLLLGKHKTAEGFFQQGIELSDMLGEMSQKAWYLANLAYLYMRSGDYGRAHEACILALESAEMKQDLDTQRRILHIQGLVYAAQGSLDEAADMARRLKESADTGMNAKAIRYVHHLEGAIASARGNFSQAAENFREALSFMPAVFEAKDWFSLFVFSLAAAEAGAGEKGKARKQFESILPLTSGRLYCGDVYAKAFFELGKLDQEKGDIENARQNYERYLGLLENSDFMYPEKAEAKKRLDSLQEP